jgi:integrase
VKKQDVIESYIRDVLVGGQRSASTVHDARLVFGHFTAWREKAKKPAPEKLTKADLREFKLWLLDKEPEGRKPFHPNTARKVWVRVGALYRYLVNEDLDGIGIDRNPMAGIELPKLKMKLPVVWTMDDLRKMQAACQSNVDRVVFYAFALTGMRESEVRAFAWRPAPADEETVRAYVDLDADAIVITATKQDKARAVPLHPLLRAEIEAVHGDPFVWAESMSGTDAVDGDGEWFFPDKQVTVRVMRRLLKAASTAGHEHQFRRTFVTWMDEAGIPESVRNSITGHTNKTVEAKHYLAIKDERKVAAIRSLYAGELPGCEALVVPNDIAGLGLDTSGLTTEQRVAVEGMIAAFRATA